MNALSIPQTVRPVQAARLSAEWAQKMTALDVALRQRGIMPVGARNIINACYGTEPEIVLAALERNRARGWSLGYIVKRLGRGILDPDYPVEV